MLKNLKADDLTGVETVTSLHRIERKLTSMLESLRDHNSDAEYFAGTLVAVNRLEETKEPTPASYVEGILPSISRKIDELMEEVNRYRYLLNDLEEKTGVSTKKYTDQQAEANKIEASKPVKTGY